MAAAATSDAAGPAVPLVGKKYMAKLGAMVNESAAGSMSSFAKRQMEKMGWTEGKGLGKEEQGMATYVRVKKREEAMGIGVETLKAEEQQNQWWYNAYDKLADKIKIAMDSDDDDASAKTKKSKDAKKKSKKSKKRARASSDSDASGDETSEPKKFRVPTDEELFAATGGKLFGRRAYGSCNGKLKRDELLVKGKLKAADGSSGSTSSADESDKTAKKDKKKKKKKESKKDKKQKKQAANDEDDEQQ